MGAWGHGPFDSDSALDLLGDIAHEHATIGDDDDLVPGSVDHVAVSGRVAAAMSGLSVESDFYSAADAYTAAGLVAAVLAPKLSKPGTNTGTRLFSVMDGSEPSAAAHLDAHCGFVQLLRAEDAEQLRPQAQEAVKTLRSAREFTSAWTSDIEPVLDEVERILADA